VNLSSSSFLFSSDLTIKAFAQWCNDEKMNLKRSPMEAYNKVLLTEESMSADISDKFDSVLLDIMMYSDANLVQESLNLLMVHKSQQELFFDTAANIQIIYSPRIEKICKELTELLRDLKRLAEMYEIWSEMVSEEDKASAAKVVRILKRIKDYTVKSNEQDKTLCIKSLVLVDEEVQNLLRNLDAMSCFMALMDSLYDGGREALKPAVVDIMRQCSELICWFVKDCEPNQARAFKDIEWFVDRVDDGVNSSAVLRAILEGNRGGISSFHFRLDVQYYCLNYQISSSSVPVSSSLTSLTRSWPTGVAPSTWTCSWA
jgi:hypothetical protein